MGEIPGEPSAHHKAKQGGTIVEVFFVDFVCAIPCLQTLFPLFKMSASESKTVRFHGFVGEETVDM